MTVLPRSSGGLDAVDRRLIDLLAEDGRLSVRSLGREVGMSPGAISERVAKLERDGVIRGYHADVNLSALGFGMEVIIGLQMGQGPSLEDALLYLGSIPEVQRLYVVSGQWDLVVHIRVRDQDHLRQTILGSIWNVSEFRHSETMLVLESRQVSATWFTGQATVEEDGYARAGRTDGVDGQGGDPVTTRESRDKPQATA